MPTSQPDSMNPSMVYQKTSLHVEGHVHVHRDDLQRMFHLPLADAACKIGLRSTTFKKTCRRLGVTIWPYRKGTKRHTAYTDTQIATPPTSLRLQSLCAPASMMSKTEQDHDSATNKTEQDHDSATNNASSSTASFPTLFAAEERGLDQHVSAAVPLGARRVHSPCTEAVMDYLDACEVGGASGLLSLLENEGLS